MSESNLSINLTYLQEEVGYYLGYGSAVSSFSSAQLDRVNRAIQRGLRQFYKPPSVDQSGRSHMWSFLKSVYTITTEADMYQYDLPDSFGVYRGDRLSFDSTVIYSPGVIIIGSQKILFMRQNSSSTGQPTHASIQTKIPMMPVPLTGGQRFEITFYPTPDAVYTLYLPFEVLPWNVSAAMPYPLGGEIHAETILQSCKAAAEANERNKETIEHERYLSLLVTSIYNDNRNDPAILGQGASSDIQIGAFRSGRLTYEGNIYGV